MGLLQGGQGRSQGVVLRPAAVQLLLDGLPAGSEGPPGRPGYSAPLGHGRGRCAAGRALPPPRSGGPRSRQGQSGAPRPSRRRPPSGRGRLSARVLAPSSFTRAVDRRSSRFSARERGGGYAEGVRHRGGEGVHQLQQPPAGLPRPGRCARPGPAPPPPAFGRLRRHHTRLPVGAGPAQNILGPLRPVACQQLCRSGGKSSFPQPGGDQQGCPPDSQSSGHPGRRQNGRKAPPGARAASRRGWL